MVTAGASRNHLLSSRLRPLGTRNSSFSIQRIWHLDLSGSRATPHREKIRLCGSLEDQIIVAEVASISVVEAECLHREVLGAEPLLADQNALMKLDSLEPIRVPYVTAENDCNERGRRACHSQGTSERIQPMSPQALSTRAILASTPRMSR